MSDIVGRLRREADAERLAGERSSERVNQLLADLADEAAAEIERLRERAVPEGWHAGEVRRDDGKMRLVLGYKGLERKWLWRAYERPRAQEANGSADTMQAAIAAASYYAAAEAAEGGDADVEGPA